MPLDPELLKQLIESFSTELDEHTQTITNGLLSLEKNHLTEEERAEIIQTIFRSAHNIKGTARSIGIHAVGEIAHRIESLFSSIKQNSIQVTPDTIDLCLEAVDKMNLALQEFVHNQPLSFDLEALLKDLEPGQTPPIKLKKENKKTKEKNISGDHEITRVSTQKIDNVFSLLEELQVNKIALSDHYSEIKQLVMHINEFTHLWEAISHSIPNPQLYQLSNDCFLEISKSAKLIQKNMKSRIYELSVLSHSLKEEIDDFRMVPIENLFFTLPRYIRDLEQELNKKIELTIKGQEIKIDKSVLEGLKNPIIHLIRNAIDHGIENSSERKLKNKPEEGHISIEITEQGGKIMITLSDDGRGIDIKKVLETIKNKNYLSNQELEKLTEDEIIQFIFHSGFSTKEIITDLSGRGVGLDIVKTNLEDLKGSVSVSTHLNNGTTFTLSVPITISSEHGLLIKCSGQHFVIPLISVERILTVNKSEIIEIQGDQAIHLDNHTIPLKILSEVMDFEDHSIASRECLSIMIIKKGGHTLAFAVDEVIGEREMVIKPFTPPLSKIPCVLGGTLLDSNQVIVVLEPGDLINYAFNRKGTTKKTVKLETNERIEKPHILVVDDSITTRTLEKSILESKNFSVTVAVNGKEAWEILQKQKFSLLITDVTMPIMDGFTLTDNVKKSEKLKNLPVIIVTSLGSDAEKKRGIEAGADAYIVKNEFESGVLLNIVSQFI